MKTSNKEWYKKWWWVIVFCLLLCIGFDSAVKKKKKEITLLSMQLNQILSEKAYLEEEKGELLARIESQNDPAWVELVLMKELGVVPTGYMKVYFKKDSS